MVMIDDLQKRFLYQRLNLGFECHICKRLFLDRFEHLHHLSICKLENLKCQKCDKVFGHPKILELHMQFHNLNQAPPVELPDVVASNRQVNDSSSSTDDIREKQKDNKESSNEEVEIQECNVAQFGNGTERGAIDAVNIFDQPQPIEQLQKTSYRPIRRPRQSKKPVGLTKIRMEDCLRCDECSCIYLEDKDYYKHMKNFHQVDFNNTPILQHKTKRKCRSCCKQCRGGNCSSNKRPRATSLASNLIFRINMRDNIKDRWARMVTQQIDSYAVPMNPGSHGEMIEIKPDPDSTLVKSEPDLTHLLSQVEVKIKTEPEDYYD